jgi:hypothetical protein
VSDELIIVASIVVREDFKSHLKLLLGSANFIVQFGMMQSQTTIDSKCLESIFVILGKSTRSFVHHLDNTDHSGSNEYRHTKDGLGVVARNLVHGTVESLIRVRIRYIKDLTCCCNLTRYTCSYRKPIERNNFQE